MNVLAISYGKNLFTPGVERDRQLACAAVMDNLHTIVFLRRGNETVKTEGNFHLYPSGGRSKIGMLIGAYRTGAKILKQQINEDGKESWIITTQDPFESGLVGFLLSKRFGLPLNIQEHGDFFSTPHWARESLLNRVRVWCGGWLMKRADTVRVVSNRIRNTMLEIGVSQQRLRQLAVAVPLDKFHPATAGENKETKKQVTIITVARLVPQKNLPLLLRSFCNLYKKYPQARLVIVGSGPQESLLHSTEKELFGETVSPITFMPWSDNVSALLQTADIYALSSNYEGYARVIPEAMATGLPIVMTEVGCAGELCINDIHGLVVPVGDAVAFASALGSLVESASLRQRYGTAGIAAATNKINTLTEYPLAWRTTLT